MAKTNRFKDINQLTKLIADIARGEAEDDSEESTKNLATVALGRLKGGKARANSVTSEKRKEIAQKTTAKRWDRGN